MKKHLYLILAVFILITSCKKEPIPPEKFSNLGVEESKTVIENSGIEFMETMDEMKGIDAIEVIINFGELLDESEPDLVMANPDSKLRSTLKGFTSIAQDGKSLNSFFDAMIISGEHADDPESIQEVWEANVGTYTWNESMREWNIVNGGDNITFLFPSIENSSTNDAKFVISDYEGVIKTNPLDDEYTGDLPVALNASMSVDNQTLLSFTFGASYNTEGIPNNIAADFEVQGYKFEVDITNNTELVNVNYRFTENGNVVMEMNATGNGLFTEDNYENNTITHTGTDTYISDWIYYPETGEYEPIYSTWEYEWEETEYEEIITSASASFQLYDIQINGEINIKGLIDEIKIIDDQYYEEIISEDTADEQAADAINEYVDLKIVQVSTNVIIAEVEAYVEREVEYDDEVYTWINFALVFYDDSKVDVETYFDNGFDEFIDELNYFINDLNYDYDIEIENIDY